ncbi:hypothetical protein [Turicibacter sp. 1E2]|uniref:hypothetical protein n=1 Tax=Turicibacter sp. 1E2 TaxID=2951143 RepID=UPI00397F8788
MSNALVYSYTNAICEGNVNGMKMIKRQMYGQENFELLRIKGLFTKIVVEPFFINIYIN